MIAPSSLALTVECQAWVGLTSGMPKELLALATADTAETLEGNAADWVAKQYAAGVEIVHGAPTPVPGVKVDWDMIHGAKMWANALGYGAVYGAPVIIERIHPTDCWGEPDGWVWNAIDGVLKVLDYKYGFGVVEDFENWQLIAYVIGIIDTLGLTDSEVKVEMTVVQPRAFHPRGPVRTWKVQGDDLRSYANVAHNAAIRALPTPGQGGDSIPKPLAVTGLHCLHCPARFVCKTYQSATTQVVEFVARAESTAMTPADLGIELGIMEMAEKMLEGRLTALRAQAEHMLRSGKRVPGYAMEQSTAHLAWLPDVTVDEVLALGQNLDKPVDLRKPVMTANSRNSPLVTPTQAIKAGVDAAVISQYSARPPGAMKLARTTLTEATRLFGANDP